MTLYAACRGPLPRGLAVLSRRRFGLGPDPRVKAFLEANTEVTSSGSLTPEIRLRLLTPSCKFWWERAERWPLGDPYWAIYWPGGQALSRYLLDNPEVVRGKSVLDLGSGCGATAIAAQMSGASRVLANDIDPGITPGGSQGTTWNAGDGTLVSCVKASALPSVLSPHAPMFCSLA